VVFALLIIGATHAQPSVLQTGKWYKVAVEKNGVFKIDRNLFKKMGFDPSKTDPRKIKIYGNEGGMLPQANSAARPIDLTELAIQVQGESDGVFNAGDYILFTLKVLIDHTLIKTRRLSSLRKICTLIKISTSSR
jgi:hypothetical protein